MQRSHNRLVFLHGFLGSPQDWEGVIRCLPEFSCQALEYPFQIPPNSIVIGYSMGGRIALRCSQPKIVLSTHPGLQTPEEKAARSLHDQQWAHKLRHEPLEIFLKAWYDQPLFESLRKHPDFPKIFSRRLKHDSQKLALMLEQESLAHQEFSLPKAIFLHGQFDTKFAQLYQSLKIPSLEISDAGHAAHLENPQGFAVVIRQGVKVLFAKSCDS